ncbi:MAG: RNA ligase family protein [Actinomycetota bacterium]|nr:RNA ligase family protein [Actinomycetota bacterium]
MSPPPRYPRIPHLAVSPAVTADDAVLTPQERARLLAADVVVEEKLDGMNVVIWIDDGVPRVGTRGGADTSDRSGERGRVRSWALTRADVLRDVLGDRYALYAEWLRRRHAVAYDRLASELVGFDVLDRVTREFLPVDARDSLLHEAGVVKPPRKFAGTLISVEALDELLGASSFGATRAEGVVVRSASTGVPRVAKHVDPAWRDVGRAAWAGENALGTVGAPTRSSS